MKRSELGWMELLAKLREATSEKEVQRLLDAELARGDDKRPQWVYRIHGRLNKLRRRREVADLV